MTPDKARRLLDNFDRLLPFEAELAMEGAAKDLAAMIAGMRPEYAVQVLREGKWQYSRGEDDFRWQDLAVQMVRTVRDHPGEETRIVRRYVTEPEVCE